MSTRRRSSKPVTGNEGAERRSLALNTSKKSGASSKTSKVAASQNKNSIEQPIAADVFDDANISDDEEGGTRIGDIYIPPPIPAHCSTESKGPRLIIRKIENNNFKSYAGKVVLGPFHHVSTKGSKKAPAFKYDGFQIFSVLLQ